MALTMSSKAAFFSGTQLRQTQPRAQRTHSRAMTPVKAKYGDESTFFDLNDLENTVGSWDLYGQQDERRYPGIQNEFFERAAAPVTRRQSTYAIITGLAFVGVGIWGAVGAKAVQLPITVGPKKGGEKGPRGRK